MILPRPRLCRPLALGLCLLPLLTGLPAQTPGQPPVLPRAVGSPSATALPPLPAGATVGPVKFGEVSIDSALEMLERWSGRSVLRPNGLPATSLTFNLDQRVSRDEARQALETLLNLNGIAVTPLGEKFLKVVPAANAKGEAPPFIEGSTLDLPAGGTIASKLFQLRYLRVSEFAAQQLNSLLQPALAAAPALFEKANAVLVTDTISNLQRIEQLVRQLDQPPTGGLKPKAYKLHNTTASTLAGQLQTLFGGNAGTLVASGTTFQADDRTNQLVVVGDERQFGLFDEIIAKLDSESELNNRQEVIPLKHADATEVANVISQLVTGQSAANARAGATNAIRNSNAASAAAGQAQGANAANAARPPGTNVVVTQQPQVNFGTLMNAFQAAQAAQQFSSTLTVVADTRSNSLVASGTIDDLRLLKNIVSQLDVLLAQVRIEVVIAEITLEDAATSGIDSLGLVLSGDKLVGFSGAGAGTTIKDGVITRPGTTGRFDLAGTITLGTTPRKNNTNILSVPNIVTTHNKEATIFVGESFPVITGYQNTGTTTGNNGTGYTSTVTYKDIGISLTVTPLIGNDGSVQLAISQKVDDVVDNVTIDGNAQPVIGSRTTESFVSAKTGEIVVLGGLQRKSNLRKTSRLGPIPLLGDLFGGRTKSETRTDLIFFLRPYVLTNTPADNTEALDRLQTSPQRTEIENALHGKAPTADKR